MKKNFLFVSLLLAYCMTGFAQDDAKIISLDPTLYYSFEKDDYRTPTYLYDFDDPSNLGKATIGDVPLEFYNAADLSTPNASGIQAVAGPTATKGAIYVDPTAVIKVNNPSGPTANGGNRLDVYTILWDVKLNEMSDFNSFVQFSEENADDGDLFTKAETSSTPGVIGTGDMTYTTVGMQVDTWYRLIFTSGGATKKLYLNGVEVQNIEKALDRFKIGDFFWIFMDDGAERMPLDCSKFAFWADRALNIVDIGRAGFGGSPTAIKTVETSAGKVYAENGKLHVEGYSASASVEVYNLVGQKIAAAKSLNGNTINVSNGLYIVKVTDKGKSFSSKVVVK
ncbi:MAG: T9SS type A sorting domain-containing protein [Prevotellaceae bacterium]|jgi:hypothetical protein|nr:T9SS type A sorting domain-containing protein [Prevotellaceae bacterium]